MMLSAIAARKAALAAKEAANPPPPQFPSPTQAKLADVPVSRKTKRKPASQPIVKEKKRPRATKPPSTKRQSQGFENQDDMIILPSSDDDSDDNVVIDVDSGSSDEEELTELPDFSQILPTPRQTDTGATDAILSTFNPIPGQNFLELGAEENIALGLADVEGTAFGLSSQDSMCLLGICSFRVLQGSISINGTTLRASPVQHSVFALSSSPLPVIRPASTARDDGLLPGRLAMLRGFDAVIVLQHLSTGVEALGRVCKTFEQVFVPPKYLAGDCISLPGIPAVSLVLREKKEIRPFLLPSSWAPPLDQLHNSSNGLSSPVCLIKGSKKCGKSTFARTVVNRLLERYQRVAFLECDLGQSEFTPGGMVALNVVSSPLFGPPFTHPTLPTRAHYIGSSNPRSSPSHYLDSVLSLIETYRLEVRNPDLLTCDDEDVRHADDIPLVVNTMGWAKGLGLDLTQRIQDYLEPTDIFEIQTPADENTFIPASRSTSRYDAYNSGPQSADGQSTARHHHLLPVSSYSTTAGYSAADQRSINLLSYFYAQFPSPERAFGELHFEQVNARSWNVSRPLLAMPPYDVVCSDAFDKVILSGAGSEDVVPSEIGRVINGALVGLVVCQPGTVDVDLTTAVEGMDIPYTQNQRPPLPTTSRCVGLALVRGVGSPSPSTTEESSSPIHLHIITPIAPSSLAQARVLVKGEMELPIWGMLDFETLDANGILSMEDGEGSTPFLQWGRTPEGAIGAQKRKVRRNLMRKGQM